MDVFLAWVIGLLFCAVLWAIEIAESKPEVREWAERMANRIVR